LTARESGAECELTGRLRVVLPPREAFRLFTPRGEQDWVAGWRPVFPVPVEDDSAPGTVFQTYAHGTLTTWVVLDREQGRHIRYARVTPQSRAGTVSVALDAVDGGSEVEVNYRLTALTDAARPELLEFADGFPAFLRSWSEAIAAWLARPS
jgi:hypothetical protein